MMDKEKWKIPKSIATESTPGVVLEKYSKYFKEPEGMTTISLDDGRGESKRTHCLYFLFSTIVLYI